MNADDVSGSAARFRAMGTDVVCDFADADMAVATRAAAIVREVFRDNEARFSRFDPHSELSALNATCGRIAHVSDTLRQVIVRAIDAWQVTDGLFDPRILPVLLQRGYARTFAAGPQVVDVAVSDLRRPLTEDVVLGDGGTVTIHVPLDLSGIVKGVTVDAAAAGMTEAGCVRGVIDAGGDMAIVGDDVDGTPWHIAIEGTTIALRLADQGVATSGVTRRQWTAGGRRQHHLVDPRDSARTSWDTLSVTVVAADAATADIWAKALFVSGYDHGVDVADAHGLAAVWRTAAGGVVLSRAAQDIVVP